MSAFSFWTHPSFLLPSMITHHPRLYSYTLNTPKKKTTGGSLRMRRCRCIRQAALQAIQLPPHIVFLTLSIELLKALWAFSFNFYIILCLDHSVFTKFLQYRKTVKNFPFQPKEIAAKSILNPCYPNKCLISTDLQVDLVNTVPRLYPKWYSHYIYYI